MAINGSNFYISAYPGTGIRNGQLWKTDGTGNGTILLKDSCNPQYLTVVNKEIYFSASGKTSGNELCKTDGTAGGTVIIKDIYPGYYSSTPSFLSNVNGKVFFSAFTAASGVELWKTDGTAGGTVLVKDINQTTTAPSYDFALTPLNGKLFFGGSASDIPYFRLWQTDGTSAGTDSITGYNPWNIYILPKFATLGTAVYFYGQDLRTGKQGFCKSDGTLAGSKLIKESTLDVTTEWITSTTGLVFYVTRNINGNIYALWRSDGTEAGTFEIESGIKEINLFNYQTNGFSFAALGNILFFVQKTSEGYELWKSDGSAAGTKRVKDIYPGGDINAGFFCIYKNLLYFLARDNFGNHLWRSDGTEAGTTIFNAGISNPSYLTVSNDLLYFNGYGVDASNELYKTDGTDAGTKLVKVINPSQYSNPQNLLDVGGTLYFFANDGQHGNELWKSDGTAAGTQLVKDITPGAPGSALYQYNSSSEMNMVSVMGKLYFSIRGKLWASDGTAEGTKAVDDINLKDVTEIHFLTAFRDQLFFVGTEYKYGTELYAGVVEPSLVPVYTFTGNGDFDKPENWVNGLIAPKDIPGGVEVIIDPVNGGKCLLDVPLHFKGGKLTIKAGAKITVKGEVVVQ